MTKTIDLTPTREGYARMREMFDASRQTWRALFHRLDEIDDLGTLSEDDAELVRIEAMAAISAKVEGLTGTIADIDAYLAGGER